MVVVASCRVALLASEQRRRAAGGGGHLQAEPEVEASGLCDAGRLIDDENVVRGAAVAVPFRLSGTEVHFAGTITRRSDRDVNGVAQYEVRFPDGETWEVRRDRLFTAVELGSRALPR